ncbi:hypothetical protein KKB18_00805 [bacterium]|nr:hypothetical protein [bacterium]
MQIEKESDNTYILDARFNIDEFEDHFKVTAPEGDFDTVGGLISHMSGTVSKVGDEFSLGNLKIEILKADAKKIGKIKVIINEQREDTGDKKLDMV